MRVAALGDIHGSNKWINTINTTENIDQWIFLGDYVDSFIYDGKAIIKNLEDIIEYKKNNPTTILLLGNHDVQYLYNEEWYRCSGYDMHIAYRLEELFNENKQLFQLGIEVANYYLTHAGITQSWFERFKTKMKQWKIEVTKDNLIEMMNEVYLRGPKEAFDVIMHVGRTRGGFETNGGPLWADERELKRDTAYGLNQIVGHTPQKAEKPTKFELTTGETIIFADTGEMAPLVPIILEYEEEIISG